jgi:hypothetical protein
MHPKVVAIAITALVLSSSAGLGFAQTPTTAEQPVARNPYGTPSASTYPRADPFNSSPVNPFANAPVHRGIRNPYFGEDNPYVTSTTTPRHKKSTVNPAAGVAEQQSGLNSEDVATLLRQRGYNGINDLHPDPNSIWVWQADGMKNGRRVRLEIDNHGNFLELGASTQPCTSPGADFGAGPLGTGARISEADRCSGR